MPPPFARQIEFGEALLPVLNERAVMQVLEFENDIETLERAQIRLERYQRFIRRVDGNRAWCLARRNCPVFFMTTLELINLTRWDEAMVQRMVAKLYRDLRLRRMVRVLFQDTWTIIDQENGVIISGSENHETAWDAGAWRMGNGGLVRICLSPWLAFPLVWDMYSALHEQYLRRVTWFNDRVEMFLYLAAHQLRHLWQFEHERKIAQICRLLEIDREADADVYALRVLSRYRQHPADFGLQTAESTTPAQ